MSGLFQVWVWVTSPRTWQVKTLDPGSSGIPCKLRMRFGLLCVFVVCVCVLAGRGLEVLGGLQTLGTNKYLSAVL